MRIRSVEWAILGSIIGGLIFIAALTIHFLSPFLSGLAVGWWFGGLFWTYWIQYRDKEGES